MKMVVVISVEERTQQIRKIFSKNNIPFYSESEIQNFRLIEDDESDNWFGSFKHLIAGHIMFTFLDEEASEKLIDSIRQFTEESKIDTPVRVFQLNVEKYFIDLQQN